MTAPSREAPPAGSCGYLDREGVLLQERDGDDLAAHLAGCAECRELDRRTQALRATIGQLPVPRGAGHWEQAVFARIAAAERPRSRWWWAVPAAVAAAVVVLVALPRLRPPAPESPPLLALEFEAGRDRLRSAGEPAVGATLLVKTTQVAGAHAEVRVYRDDAGLLLHCSTEPPCRRQGNNLEARLTIPAIGRYRVLVVGSDSALPPPSGNYDRDAAALTVANGTIRFRLDDTFEVW